MAVAAASEMAIKVRLSDSVKPPALFLLWISKKPMTSRWKFRIGVQMGVEVLAMLEIFGERLLESVAECTVCC